MPEKLKGGLACLCCSRPLSKWQFCFINRQAIGFIRSLLYVPTTLDSLLSVGVCLLIFWKNSTQYALIPYHTFINFTQTILPIQLFY